MKTNKDGHKPGEFLTLEQQNAMRVKRMEEARNNAVSDRKKTSRVGRKQAEDEAAAPKADE